MTQRTINISIDETYCKPSRRIYITNKTNVYHTDDTCRFDKIGLKGYAPENNRGYRNILVVFDIFSKFEWTVPLKKHNNNKLFLETF